MRCANSRETEPAMGLFFFFFHLKITLVTVQNACQLFQSLNAHAHAHVLARKEPRQAAWREEPSNTNISTCSEKCASTRDQEMENMKKAMENRTRLSKRDKLNVLLSPPLCTEKIPRKTTSIDW